MARKLRDEGHQVTVVHDAFVEQAPWITDLDGMALFPMKLSDSPPGLSLPMRLLAALDRSLNGSRIHGPMRVLADLVLPLDHGHRWNITPDDLASKVGKHDIVIATGPSWSTYEFGHHISRKWNASFFLDYRDPWTIAIPEVGLYMITHLGGPISGTLRRWRMRKAEKSFTSNATGITAATPLVLRNAQVVIGDKPALVVLNGFETPPQIGQLAKDTLFSMVYTGSMYREQEWDIVRSGLELFLQQRPDLAPHFRLTIAGPHIDADKALVQLGRWMNSTPWITPLKRIDRTSSIRLQVNSDLLLHVGFKGKRGLFPIKFIEYLSAGPPIVQVSTGHDMVEDTLERTGAGSVVSTPESLAALLAEHMDAWLAGHPIRYSPVPKAMDELSWKHQAQHWYQFIVEQHRHRIGGDV